MWCLDIFFYSFFAVANSRVLPSLVLIGSGNNVFAVFYSRSCFIFYLFFLFIIFFYRKTFNFTLDLTAVTTKPRDREKPL